MAVLAGVTWLAAGGRRAPAHLGPIAVPNPAAEPVTEFRVGSVRHVVAPDAPERLVPDTTFPEQPARLLSGGEQQKLALARAWALGPEVLFLDEPTANLDPNATREVESIIGQIRASGTKIVMTTHNLGQARRLGDEILFLSQGRLVEQAPVGRFFTQPAAAEAVAFIRDEIP